MILFYSEYCQHCSVLLDTIKRFDKTNIIKTVSVDTLRSMQIPIDHKIKCVPALYLLETKKLLFGKEVFDYLILKSKLSFAGETTRDNKKQKDNVNLVNGQNQSDISQPQAFTLGAISAEYFSSIDNTGSLVNDKNYKWDLIDNSIQIDTEPPALGQVSALKGPATETNIISEPKDEDKKLPTMEEIMQRRANDIL